MTDDQCANGFLLAQGSVLVQGKEAATVGRAVDGLPICPGIAHTWEFPYRCAGYVEKRWAMKRCRVACIGSAARQKALLVDLDDGGRGLGTGIRREEFRRRRQAGCKAPHDNIEWTQRRE